MDLLFERLTPVIILLLGFLLRRFGVVGRDAADVLIKLAFNVFVPATIFYSLISLRLHSGLVVVPLAGFLLALMCFVFAFLVKDFVSSDRKTQGSFILGCGMTNQAMFSYPFFLSYLGVVGLSYAAFYDFGQAALGFPIAYFIAAYFGAGRISFLCVVKKILLFPFMWAFTLGILVNFLDLAYLVNPVNPVLLALNNANMPVVMLALGLFVEPRIRHLKAMAALISIKFVVMPILAFLLVLFLGVGGVEMTTILIASAMPPAMMSLYYSVEEELDVDFCAAFLSVGIIIGLVVTPILFSLLT